MRETASPITGLTNYAEDDNLVYTAAADLYGVGAYVDYPGFVSDPYACGSVGYCEIGPGVPGSSGLGPPPDSIGAVASFTLTAVPEASTWAMMLVGFAGLGLAGYRRTAMRTVG